MKRNPDICPYCGHVIVDDDQEYCDYCGMDIEKEEVEDNTKHGSCLGRLVFLMLIIIILAKILLKK